MLCFKDPSDFCKKFASRNQSYHERLNKLIKMHEAVEDAGTVFSYRSIDCRGCEMCKQGEKIEAITLQEEYEHHLIDESVNVNINKCISDTALPITELEPEHILVHNVKESLQIFHLELKNYVRM